MRKVEEKHENNERWLLTYSDLITLLMIFFVVMYATSNLNAEKYERMSNSFKGVFGGGENIVGIGGGSYSSSEEIGLVEKAPNLLDELSNVKTEVDKLINESSLNSVMSTKVEERGLVISFTDRMFFESGKADTTEKMRAELADVSKILKGMSNYIRIEGHTDNIPIKNSQFESNWQLSAARAANVVEDLADLGIPPDRLSAIGYGEYKPIFSNDTEGGRSKNRRVDIVILNSKSTASENKK